jgi:hypothetical protein
VSHRLQRAIRRWLQHERSGREERAERALSRVFAGLPAEAPSVAFVSRVLAGVGLAIPALRPRDLRDPRWKALTTAALVLAAGALLFVPSVTAVAWVGVRSGKLLELAVFGFVSLVEALTQGLTVIGALIGAGRAIGAGFASPMVLAMMASSALLSLLAFRFLQALMVTQRSSHHA